MRRWTCGGATAGQPSRPIVTSWAVGVLCACLLGCSLVYDPDELGFADASIISDVTVQPHDDGPADEGSQPDPGPAPSDPGPEPVPDPGPGTDEGPSTPPAIELASGATLCDLPYTINTVAPACLGQAGEPQACAEHWQVALAPVDEPDPSWSFALIDAPAFRVTPQVSNDAAPVVTLSFAPGTCASESLLSFSLQVKLKVGGHDEQVLEIPMAPGTSDPCPDPATSCGP